MQTICRGFSRQPGTLAAAGRGQGRTGQQRRLPRRQQAPRSDASNSRPSFSRYYKRFDGGQAVTEIDVHTEGWPIRDDKTLLHMTIQNGDIELRLTEVSAAHPSIHVTRLISQTN